ncbi:P-loop containing nucleoside triphosphate hydrolase protein [Cokeromyces recurvatus]|uniref:P-loop containing nucleoside triphosphate hydrolase protein n=1 Tax=Cokeromyces recurvatus TaxID=90255 RepID=UPI00222121CA|nr:P-loop containing nucleoside triphosphate hydrolase protein [Cokeromyces recurvatus]KAI7907411.1 P-loop containing nucleoside triphosphate hydrolase protein [Cokeromyces recurvatus]
MSQYMQYSMLSQTKESLSHILHHYELFKQDHHGVPMIVGISGCQGSGKTTLCNTLSHLLKQEPYNLRIVNFSLDDVYLKHEDQLKLAKHYNQNLLYQQRGQAGSHDLTLATKTLDLLLTAKEGETVPIPVYDKSLYEGQGDRLDKSQWKYPMAPFDIILFEGWMLGFKSLNEIQQSDVELIHRENSSAVQLKLEDIQVLNNELKRYERELYPFFDIFIHLSPAHLEQVYEWRLQQEHHMKETRGVSGLSDDAVRAFVDSYMPAYELYLPRLDKVGFFGYGDKGEKSNCYEGLNREDKGYSQPERHLKIVLDQDRKMLKAGTIKESVKSMTTNYNQAIITRTLLYRCAFIGIFGFMLFRHKSILDSFVKLSKHWTS